MKNRIGHYLQIMLVLSLLALASTPAWAQSLTADQADQLRVSMTQQQAKMEKLDTLLDECKKGRKGLKKSLDEQREGWAPPSQGFIYFVVCAVLGGAFLTLLIVRVSVEKSGWSLADALSEEAEITLMETLPSGVIQPILDATTNQPVMVTKLCASTSRMIALMGTIVILLMFLGFGVTILFSFAKTGIIPGSVDKVLKFLIGGLALFAPYGINKFSDMLSPKGK